MSTIELAGRKTLVLLSGRAYPELADEIAAEIGITVMPTTAMEFANGETFIKPDESVRGSDAFVIQSYTTPMNQWVMESLILVRRPQARLGQAHHRRHAVLPVLAPGQEAPGP